MLFYAIEKFEILLNTLFEKPYLRFLIVGFAGTCLFMGINITHDSFAYLEGAINIVNGNGFVVNCNLLSASAYQPLFSYVMIPFILIFGYTGVAIITFHIILFLITFFIYERLLLNTINEITPFVRTLSIFVLIYPYFTILLSESLLITLLGLYLNILFFYKGRVIIKYFWVITLLTAIFLTKNSALFIIIPIHLSLFDFVKGKGMRSYLLESLSLMIIVVIFLLIKIILGSVESHQFVFGSGSYPLKSYLFQIYSDVSVWIFGSSVMHFISNQGFEIYFELVSIAILIFILVKAEIKYKHKLLLFLLYALAIHLIVFSNVSIGSELAGRFLFWFNFVFVFLIISQCHLKRSFMIIFLIIAVSNSANIAYGRYKTFKPFDSKEVVLKMKYSLDQTPFYTDQIRYPSLVFDEKSSKYIITSPAYPSMINR